ncbi:hypothetical protein NGR_b09560 (plasmid) [Sinorhizobium fredii NGR234]|uniref:Uncharacterized protein n=1 Tax=Sinorhizobium fredii (strain NBRC 101917 / NGR234) TaxID=394 RepID=C3KQQ4_SINFN|nr:hypothetical protein NGR_b09560 [Sinorhizobium fredii NGR234]
MRGIPIDVGGKHRQNCRPHVGFRWRPAIRKQECDREPALQKLAGLILHAGLQVEAFIQAGERTALSYLVKPLADQSARTMREE